MTIEIKEMNGGYTAEFSGRLDTPAAVQATKDMQPLMEQADKEIILDCTNLEYISSSGLRIFISILKSVKARKGEVIVQNINDEIRKVFEMTGFNKLFIIK